MSENFNKGTWWHEIESLKANINKLEQENKELKATVPPTENGKNRYGLDVAYFRKLINRELNRPLTDYKPDELARICLRMAMTADDTIINEREFTRRMAEHDDELILQTFKDAYKAGFDHGLQSDKDEIEKLNGTSDSVGMFDYYFEQHIKGIALIYIHQKSQEKSNEMDT